MSFSVNTNGNALAAIRTLNATQKGLNTIQARINSGLKVAGAKDDASTFAIAQGLRGDIAGFKAISDAISFGQATVNVASNAAQSVSDTLNALKAKITAAQADNVDRSAIQKDIDALVSQVTSITNAAQFNGVNLLNNTDSNVVVLASLNRADASTAPTAFNITVDAQNLTASGLGLAGINVKGAGQAFTAGTSNFTAGNTITFDAGVAGSTVTFEFVANATDTLSDASHKAVVIGSTVNTSLSNLISSATTNGLTAGYDTSGALNFTSNKGDLNVSATVAGGSFAALGTASNVSGALTTIETAINSVKTALASFGTKSTQLETQGTFVKSLTDTLTEGVGTLVDADLAEESANLQAAQTRQQLGIQALSIANQGPGAVLSLFR